MRTLLATLTLSMLFAATASAQPGRPWGDRTGTGTGTATQPGSTSTGTPGTTNGGRPGGPFGGGNNGGNLPNDGRGGPFTPGENGNPAGPYTPGTIDTDNPTSGPFSPREEEKGGGWSLWGGIKKVGGWILGGIRQVSEIIYTLDAIRNVADWFGGLFHRSPGASAVSTLPTNGFGNNTSRFAPTNIGGANTPAIVRTALDTPVVVVNPTAGTANGATSEGAAARIPGSAGVYRGSRALNR